MQISFEGDSFVTVSSLPEGLLAQLSPMMTTGQYPGTCNPAAYITEQQGASLESVGAGGVLDRINAWVNDNTLLAAGVVALGFMAAGGKIGK